MPDDKVAQFFPCSSDSRSMQAGQSRLRFTAVLSDRPRHRIEANAGVALNELSVCQSWFALLASAWRSVSATTWLPARRWCYGHKTSGALGADLVRSSGPKAGEKATCTLSLVS